MQIVQCFSQMLLLHVLSCDESIKPGFVQSWAEKNQLFSVDTAEEYLQQFTLAVV